MQWVSHSRALSEAQKMGMCSPGLTQDWTQPQVLHGMGTAAQSTDFCRCWLFDFYFYRAGFDIIS